METRNALILSTTLRCEGNNIVFYNLHLKFGGLGGSFGGNEFATDACEIIDHILEIVGVYSWEDLPGKYIRIQYNCVKHSIDAIGNLMEEKWFNIREYFANKED